MLDLKSKKFTKDPQFLSTTMDVEKSMAFLGNAKDSDYQSIVENMWACFQALGCRMSLKVHFLHARLDYFPQNLGDMSKVHEERFHQDIQIMGIRYQGRWDVFMIVDYSWYLKCACKSSDVAERPKEENLCLTPTKKKTNLV